MDEAHEELKEVNDGVKLLKKEVPPESSREWAAASWRPSALVHAALVVRPSLATVPCATTRCARRGTVFGEARSRHRGRHARSGQAARVAASQGMCLAGIHHPTR